VHRPPFRRAQGAVEPPSEEQLGRLLFTEDAWTIA
jgi:hypothetical protein